ncbi:MAG: hypothetical protein AAGF94_13400 [Pseudomonadota bacterium]
MRHVLSYVLLGNVLRKVFLDGAPVVEHFRAAIFTEGDVANFAG